MATTIKIGHASFSEHSTAYGTAGDTTGYEVCINPNFTITSLNPTVALRPKTATIAEASALACEAGCSNDHIGYSQSGRNTLYNLAKNVDFNLSKVLTDCNTDCSAFMTVCAIAGGARISYGTNAPTTTNMRTRFKQSGDYTILTDAKHLTMTDYLKRGDILVCEGDHTVMVLENGSSVIDDTQDPGSTVTPTSNIRTYLLMPSIVNIKANSATVKLNVIEQINGIEKDISNTSKWTYRLELKALPSLKITDHKFANKEITLTGLTAGGTYMVRAVATKTDGAVAFCSADQIFTTEQKNTSVETHRIEFGDKTVVEPFEHIDKVYVKIQDEFKQAIIYKNT